MNRRLMVSAREHRPVKDAAREAGAGKEEGWRETVHWDGHHTGKAHMIWVSWINLLNFTLRHQLN